MYHKFPFRFWQNPPYPHYRLEIQPSLPGFLSVSIGERDELPVFTAHLYIVRDTLSLPTYERSVSFFLPDGWNEAAIGIMAQLPVTMDDDA